jgi:nitrile hydratase accessory protein
MTAQPSPLPATVDDPVFAEPWEAQAFALVNVLHSRGHVAWPEWADFLSSEIKKAQNAGDSDDGSTYYSHWLSALEAMVISKALVSEADLKQVQSAWREAALRTPHGHPIELLSEIRRTDS